MTNQDGPDGQRAAEVRAQQHDLQNTSDDVQEESLQLSLADPAAPDSVIVLDVVVLV